MATKKVKTAESVSIGEVTTPATAPAKGKHSSAHRKPARAAASKSPAPAPVSRPADDRKAAAEDATALPLPAAGESTTPSKSAKAKKKVTAGPVLEAAAAPAKRRSPSAGRSTRSKKVAVAATKVVPDALATVTNAESMSESVPPVMAMAAAASASGDAVLTAAIAMDEAPAYEAPSPESLRAEIAQLAYHLWLDGGCRHGRDHEDWAEAERQVLSRYSIR